jgi:hypothetical protein
MTVYHLLKSMPCNFENETECVELFVSKLNSLSTNMKFQVNYHVTISHIGKKSNKRLHEIFVTFYDKGVFENWHTLEKHKYGKIADKFEILTEPLNPTQKKFTQNIPTFAQIDKL